jgi:fibro-slime domain-containing protein
MMKNFKFIIWLLFVTGILMLNLDAQSDEPVDMSKRVIKKATADTIQIRANAKKYYQKGDYKKSIKEYKKLIILEPESSTLRYELGMAYYKNFNYRRAVNEFVKSYRIDPSNKEVDQMIDKSIPSIIDLPVIYYDYRADESNPNFQAQIYRKTGYLKERRGDVLVVVTALGLTKRYKLTKDTIVHGPDGIIPNGTSLIRPENLSGYKAIRFQLNPKKKDEILVVEDFDPAIQSEYPGMNKVVEGLVYDKLSEDRKPVMKKYIQPHVNHNLDKWFYPSGIEKTDTEFAYDEVTSTWRWTDLEPYRKSEDQFVGKNFNDQDLMANIVIYDHMQFHLNSKKGERPVYKFRSKHFFPVDDRGFGNEVFRNNYAFSMELHSKFLYRGGEYFNFRGDDDIWLYIDGDLVMDMGGIHPTSSNVIYVDEIPGLKKGNLYDFDLFFAERNYSGSSLRIEGSFIMELPDPIAMGIQADKSDFIPSVEEVTITVIGPEDEHKEWMIGIWNRKGEAVKVVKGEGKVPREIIWDGKDVNGDYVPENEIFRIMAKGVDEAYDEWESNILRIKSIPRLKRGSKLILTSIYFKPFSSDLSRKSDQSLKRMLSILKKQKNIKLRVSGHTAPWNWPTEKLIKLSTDRAKTVVDYFINQGISANRLEFKGYGDTDPIKEEEIDEEKLKGKNISEFQRRTEFEVISD